MTRIVRPLVFMVCASSIIDVATDTPSVNDRYLGPFFQLTCATQVTSTSCATALVLLTFWLLFENGKHTEAPAVGRVWALLLRLLPGASMVFTFLWTRALVDRTLAIPWNAMVVTAPFFLLVSALRRWPPIYTAGIIAVVGVAVRLVHFSYFSIGDGADMLPLTRSAVARFLAGRNPYTYYDLPSPTPLTYYPLTWLAFLPAYLAHIDLRWTNIVAEMALLGAILHTERANGHPPWSTGAATLAWGFHFLLPSSVYFDRITTAPVAWALISWCVALSARESRYGWLLLGLTAAATPLALIVAPLVFATWWFQHSPREASIRGVKALLVATVICAPFIIWSPRGFVNGTVLWFNDLSRYPSVTWRAYRPWERYIGFGGLFWRTGFERALAPIQWLLVGGIAALYAKRGAPGELLPSRVAGAFVAFMAFNSVHWPYFYQPAIYGALLAIAVAENVAQGKTHLWIGVRSSYGATDRPRDARAF